MYETICFKARMSKNFAVWRQQSNELNSLAIFLLCVEEEKLNQCATRTTVCCLYYCFVGCAAAAVVVIVRFSFNFIRCMRPICACSCIQNAPPVIITGVTVAVAVAIHVRHFVRQHSANFMQNIYIYISSSYVQWDRTRKKQREKQKQKALNA